MANLDKEGFVRVLRQFADDPDDVMVEMDTVVCKVNRTEITLTLSLDEDDVLYCNDGTREWKAKLWIERNLAHLGALAERILSEIPEERHFVPVPSVIEKPTGECERCLATTDKLFEELRQRKLFTSAVYLLSNAGEGKTIVMNRLARMTANAYLKGQIHFLFLPIELGGRPFMRFDDLFIGELARKFRFRDYYFNSLVELVKLGFLVLGLDGFEEMSVEGKDDKVISSLGELLAQFDSQGKIIVSARKAFYEFALENRCALGDVMEHHDIEFSAYRLEPWSTDQFCALMDSYGFSSDEKDHVLDTLIHRLGASHPILKRPVLAHKLVDYIYQNNGEYTPELAKMSNFLGEDDQSKVLDEFVFVLMHREATYKWITRSKESGGQQLLKVDDHYQLMQYLAEEMWVSRTEFLSSAFLKEWMGVVCGALKIGVAETRDCQEKILYHAFLKNEGTQYAFCHEAFAMYFLGRQIGSYLAEDSYGPQLLQLLSVEILPDAVIDEAAYQLAQTEQNFEKVLEKLLRLKGGVSRNTPMGQNIGGLILVYRNKLNSDDECVLKDLYFSKSIMYGQNLRHVTFDHCLIEEIYLRKNRLFRNVKFDNSQIDAIGLDSEVRKVEKVVFDERSLPGRLICQTSDIYNPILIKNHLKRIGCEMSSDGDEVATVVIDQPVESDEFSVLMKVLKYFSRTYYITDNLLSVKFGSDWGRIQRDVFPLFIKNGILEVSSKQRSAHSDGYRMACPLSRISKAQKMAKGDFQEFLSVLKTLR